MDHQKHINKKLSFPLLFSVDLEYFYPANTTKSYRHTPIPIMVNEILFILREAKCRATFFVVGELAREFPNLIEKIINESHEVGCHGDRHCTLNQLSPIKFREDLKKNREALKAAGATDIRGFRAPVFSLTNSTAWAYPILKDEGFDYSSSVLPSANPLFGWPEFGDKARRIAGVLEIPITTTRLGPISMPIFGGTYFRILPWPIVKRKLIVMQDQGPILSYVHPYDFDTLQPWTMHSGVNGNPLLNTLLFVRRRNFGTRVRCLLNSAARTTTYGAFSSTFPY